MKSISITETTPEADYTYVYNDTDSYDGDYYSNGYASWDYYDTLLFPEHSMRVHLQNDIDEVDTWYEYDLEKYSGTNIKLLSVTTSPTVTTSTDHYTWIDCDSVVGLDPANYSVPHGVLKGTIRNTIGETVKGAEVRISHYGEPYIYIYKITDENGKYSVMLPPEDYDVSADYGFKAYDNEYESMYNNVIVEKACQQIKQITIQVM